MKRLSLICLLMLALISYGPKSYGQKKLLDSVPSVICQMPVDNFESFDIFRDDSTAVVAAYSNLIVFSTKTGNILKNIDFKKRFYVSDASFIWRDRDHFRVINNAWYGTLDISKNNPKRFVYNDKAISGFKCMAIHRNGSHWAVGTPDGARIYSDKPGSMPIGAPFYGMHSSIRSASSLSFSPTNECIAMVAAGHISIWEYESGALIKDLGECKEYTKVVYSPDGSYLAQFDNKKITIWSIQDYKASKTLGTQETVFQNSLINIHDVKFSPDGNYVLVSMNGIDSKSKLTKEIRIYRLKDEVCIQKINIDATSMKFSESGRIMLAKVGSNVAVFKVNQSMPATDKVVEKNTTGDSAYPVITWITPTADQSSTSEEHLQFHALIQNTGPDDRLELFLNNEQRANPSNVRMVDNLTTAKILTSSLNLKPGANSIKITLSNSKRILSYDRDLNYDPIKIQLKKPTVVSNQGKRLALVIGNSIYGSSNNSLKNPANDADSIETALKSLGFTVIKIKNTTKIALKHAVDDFTKQLTAYDVGLFFYAGHGMEVEGVNYLIPCDAPLDMNKSDVEDDCVNISWITGRMGEAGNYNKTNIVIVDACRKNPFRNWKRSSGEDTWVAPTKIPTGLITAFASSEGQSANDGKSSNGLYTSLLLKHIRTQGISIEEVFKRIRVDLFNIDEQEPVEETKLMKDFYFNP